VITDRVGTRVGDRVSWLCTPHKEVGMFSYIGLVKLLPEGREHLVDAPKYLDQIKKIVEEEGGVFEKAFAIMGPWDFLALVKYPDNETAFRVLGRIGKLEVVKTETYPCEEVEIFIKALV